MRVRQRVPDYIDAPWWEGEVEDQAALMALDWVQRWTEDEDFDRWSYSKAEQHHPSLMMAEMKDGKFWVVAFVWGDLDLPIWH